MRCCEGVKCHDIFLHGQSLSLHLNINDRRKCDDKYA